MANEQSIERLRTLLPEESTLYGVVTQYGRGRNGTTRHFKFFTTYTRDGKPELSDVSIHVARVLGLRRTKIGAVATRDDMAEVAAAVKGKIGRDCLYAGTF